MEAMHKIKDHQKFDFSTGFDYSIFPIFIYLPLETIMVVIVW
jgi:hypothetical protein